MMESPTKSETKVRRFIRTQYYADAMKEAQSAWNDGVAQDTVKHQLKARFVEWAKEENGEEDEEFDENEDESEEDDDDQA